MKNSMYALLEQQGPFVTGTSALSTGPFSKDARKMTAMLKQDGLVTKYRVLRNQVFDFLNVASLREIQLLLKDPARRRETGRRGYALLGNMFGIDGTEQEIIGKINNHSRTADGVIRHLKNTVLSRYGTHIEITNEIDIINSPVELLLINFDDRYHQKARFEAKRKLILMILAGSIEQRERETEVESKFTRFLDFLNEYVWSPSVKIGELEPVYLYSRHDPETFACRDVTVVNPREAQKIDRQQPGVKMTLVKRRRFRTDGREVPIYVSVRKKPPEAKVLKLIRKGEENPAIAVDDELGLLGVLDNEGDIKVFQRHLTRSAIRADSFMTLEEVADTLDGGLHLSHSPGSSARTPMFKFFARMGGMRVEFIVHTNKSYLDYIYQREVSHDEYEIKRIFDSGVADLLFPQDIFHLDMKKVRDELITWSRKRIEGH